MTNVRYDCPEEGCPDRAYTEPGGTTLTCPEHGTRMVQTDTDFEQFTEGYDGYGYDNPENYPADTNYTGWQKRYEETTGRRCHPEMPIEAMREAVMNIDDSRIADDPYHDNVDRDTRNAARNNVGNPLDGSDTNFIKDSEGNMVARSALGSDVPEEQREVNEDSPLVNTSGDDVSLANDPDDDDEGDEGDDEDPNVEGDPNIQNDPINNDPDDDDADGWRAVYERETGNKPDGRRGAASLKQELRG